MADDKKIPIYVTRPNLPPLEKLQPYLEKIWENKILTNNGPFHQQLEKKLADFLEVQNINLFTNATIALIVGLKALNIKGEVITTPYSFVATTHALNWNGIKPVFCDIEENTFNIDPEKMEKLITPETSAIMPVHVYGHPCNTSKIQTIANRHNLKVIYDAAHSFGVKLNDDNLLLQGDMSVLSFHGTKLFTTFEGGAIVTKDKELKERIDILKNFGFVDETTVIDTGINGKMNEFQAVIGLLNLETVKQEIEDRKKNAKVYYELLQNVEGITCFNNFEDYEYNYAYYPILIDKNKFGATRDDVYDLLKMNGIYARKYFYPLISNFPSYSELPSACRDNLPVANKIATEILCLPMFGKLEPAESNIITNLIISLYRS